MERRIPGAWHGSVPRAVLESHFGRGHLAVAGRLPNFAREYDLAERVVPEEHYKRQVQPEEAKKILLCSAASACGIATVTDLADYYRMPIREARPHIFELMESGELQEVKVEGWREPAYLHRLTRIPRKINVRTLLSPFDPLIWFRPRVKRLFDFEHRFEIFVPAEKRKWGCYVLPFLMEDQLVARVDLKADRSEQCLRVIAAHLEPHADAELVAEALAEKLWVMSGWLGMRTVVIGNRRGFARTLASVLNRGPKR